MTDPRIQARRVRVEREKGHRRLGVLVSVLVAAALSAGALLILHSPLFGSRSVLISGAVHTTRSQVLSASGLDRERPLVDIDTAVLERRLDRLPWVLTSRVSLQWPSGVSVSLSERVPVACGRVPGVGYALYDASGRVLAYQASRPAGLPLVVTGGRPGRPGSFLPAADRPLVAAAGALPVSLLGRLDDIVTERSDGVVLNLAGGMRAVLGDDSQLESKFVSLATVLGRMDLSGVETIDLRVAHAPVLTVPDDTLG